MRTSILGIPVLGKLDSKTGRVTMQKTRSKRCDFCGRGIANQKNYQQVVNGKRLDLHKKCVTEATRESK